LFHMKRVNVNADGAMAGSASAARRHTAAKDGPATLDLDDLGAPVGKLANTGRTSSDAREVKRGHIIKSGGGRSVVHGDLRFSMKRLATAATYRAGWQLKGVDPLPERFETRVVKRGTVDVWVDDDDLHSEFIDGPVQLLKRVLLRGKFTSASQGSSRGSILFSCRDIHLRDPMLQLCQHPEQCLSFR